MLFSSHLNTSSRPSSSHARSSRQLLWTVYHVPTGKTPMCAYLCSFGLAQSALKLAFPMFRVARLESFQGLCKRNKSIWKNDWKHTEDQALPRSFFTRRATCATSFGSGAFRHLVASVSRRLFRSRWRLHCHLTIGRGYLGNLTSVTLVVQPRRGIYIKNTIYLN